MTSGPFCKYWVDPVASGLSNGLNRNKRLVVLSTLENNHAIGEREQSMILAHSHIFARVVFGPALANDDVSSNNFLAAKNLYAEAFTFRFAAVFYFTFAFFVCHNSLFSYGPRAND